MAKGRHDEGLRRLREALCSSSDLSVVADLFHDLTMDPQFMADSEPARFPLLEKLVGEIGSRALLTRDPNAAEPSLARLFLLRFGTDFYHGVIHHALGMVVFCYFPSASQGIAVMPARNSEEPHQYMRFTLAAPGPSDVQ